MYDGALSRQLSRLSADMVFSELSIKRSDSLGIGHQLHQILGILQRHRKNGKQFQVQQAAFFVVQQGIGGS